MNKYEATINELIRCNHDDPTWLLEIIDRFQPLRGQGDTQPLHESTVQGLLYTLITKKYVSGVDLIVWRILRDEYALTKNFEIFNYAVSCLGDENDPLVKQIIYKIAYWGKG